MFEWITRKGWWTLVQPRACLLARYSTGRQCCWPQKLAFQFNWKLGCFTFLHDLGLTSLRGLFILEIHWISTQLLGHRPSHGLGGRHTYTFQLFQLRQTLFQLMQRLTVINRKRKLPTTPRKVTHRPLFYHKSTNPRLQQAETQLSHNAGLL